VIDRCRKLTGWLDLRNVQIGKNWLGFVKCIEVCPSCMSEIVKSHNEKIDAKVN
jgi:hypothetical protein